MTRKNFEIQKNLTDELAFLDDKHRLNDPVKEHDWESLEKILDN